MKAIGIRVPHNASSLYLPKALATQLNVNTLNIGQRNSLRLLCLPGHENFSPSPRYPTLTKVRQDFGALGIYLLQQNSCLSLHIENAANLDQGSQLFLQTLRDVFNVPIVSETVASDVRPPHSERDEKISRLLHAARAPNPQECFHLAAQSNLVGDHWTAIALMEKLSQVKDAEIHNEVLCRLVKYNYNLERIQIAFFYSHVALETVTNPRQRLMLHYERAMMMARMHLIVSPGFDAQSELDRAFAEFNRAEAEEIAPHVLRSVIENGQALLHIQKRNLEAALAAMARSTAAIESLKETDPRSYALMRPVALSNRSRCHLHAREIDLAAELQQQALVLEPDYLDNYVHMARIELRRERKMEAGEILHRAIALHPGDPELYFLLAKISSDPEPFYRRAQQLATGDREEQAHRFNLASWLHDARRFVESTSLLDAILTSPRDLFLFENAASMKAENILQVSGISEARHFLSNLCSQGFTSQLLESNLNALNRAIS